MFHQFRSPLFRFNKTEAEKRASSSISAFVSPINKEKKWSSFSECFQHKMWSPGFGFYTWGRRWFRILQWLVQIAIPACMPNSAWLQRSDSVLTGPRDLLWKPYSTWESVMCTLEMLSHQAARLGQVFCEWQVGEKFFISSPILPSTRTMPCCCL